MGWLTLCSVTNASRDTHGDGAAFNRPGSARSARNSSPPDYDTDPKPAVPSLNDEPGCIKVVDTFRKADASEAGEAWSDGRIAEALDTSIDTIARTRQKLVEEGLDAALTRKHSPNSARQRIFDGAAEAKLIALACSPPPKGRKRWTLTLLETAVVQLNIVDRASDNTIGRTLKKTLSSLTSRSNGSSRRRPTPPS